MADSPGRVLLVKFRGDLRSLQGTMDDVLRAVASMQRQLKTMQDKSHKSSQDNTAKAIAGEKQKQAAVTTTIKTGEKKQTQESSLQTAIAKTLALRKQETLEISRQLSLYKELATSQSKAARNISAQLAQEISNRKANQPSQGVIPVTVRTVSSTAGTVGSLAQAAEAASYQQQLMRTMRLQEAKNMPVGAAGAPNPLASGLAGGLATAQMTAAEAAAMERERMRSLRVASTSGMTVLPSTAPLSKDQQREQKKQQAEAERDAKKQALEAERGQKKQTSDANRQKVMDADAQVRIIQSTEKQKQAIVLTSAALQREELQAQLRREEIDYGEYIAKVKILIQQEKTTKIAAIDAEEKALQRLLVTQLATSKISQQSFASESTVLASRMAGRRTDVETGSMRQMSSAARQKPRPKPEDHENDAGEIFRGLGMGISKGLGGGLVGSVATGLLFGGGTLMVFDQAARGIESMIQKVKELVMETGPLQQLEGEFEHLTSTAGIDGPALMGKLQMATHGLVGNMQLLQYATGALRSNLHLTDAQTVRFATDVTELARVQGKSVPEAMAVAQRALTTGQTRGVATYLGLNQRELGLNAAPRFSTIQQREQLQYRQVQGAIEGQLNKTGVAPETMTEKIQRLQQAKSTFAEDFGSGLATSVGAKALMGFLDAVVTKFGSLRAAAKAMGDGVGNVLMLMVQGVQDVIHVAGSLELALAQILGSGQKGKQNSWVYDLHDKLTSMKGVISLIAETFNQMTLGAEKIIALITLMTAYAKGGLSSPKAIGTTAALLPTGPLAPVISGAIFDKTGAFAKYNATLDKAQESADKSTSHNLGAERDIDQLPEDERDKQIKAMELKLAHAKKSVTNLQKTSSFQTGFTGQNYESPALKQAKSDQAALEHSIASLKKEAPTAWGPGAGGSTPPPVDPAARQLAIQMKEADVKLTEATEKEKLTIVEDSLDQQRTAQKQMLHDGETDLASYVAKMKGFTEQEKTAKLSQIDAEEKAQLGLLETQRQVGELPQQLYVKKVADTTQTFGSQRAAVQRETNKQIQSLNEELDTDYVAGVRKSEDNAVQIQQDALNLRRTMLKNSYDKQLIDVDTYLQSQRQAVQDEYDIEVKKAFEAYGRTNQGLEAAMALAGQLQHATATANSQLAEIAASQTNEQVKRAQAEFSQASSYIQAQEQLRTAQQGGRELPVAEQRQDLQTQIDAQIHEIAQLNTALLQVEATSGKTGSDWVNTSNAIAEATTNLVKMEQQMQQLSGTGEKVLSGFGAIAQGLGAFPQGRTRALSDVGAIPGILSGLTTAEQQAAPIDLNMSGGNWLDTNQEGGQGEGVTAGPPGSAIGSGVSSVLGFFKALVTGSKDLPDQFKDMSTHLGSILGAVGGAAQGIASGSSVAGAVGGGALGMDIGKSFKSVANIAGPIGMIAGAAFGGILSGIIGQKQQKAADMIHTMSLQFDAVMTTFKEGVIGMNQAINESEQIRNDLQAQMQSAGKKKRQQYQSALDAMNQQILALQAQQVQMIVQMQETLPTVGATPMTDFVSQLQQIVAQYTQFAGAARNASDLAQANEYLTQSLQGYAQTQMTQMTQAEQGAIQDAINLNDLYSQRQMLLQQMADQERDIMTQGVLTRQTTTAQSKMEQIAIMKQQNELQLENLNEQISAASFRVNAEKQIFSLATTRIGLESQLLQMQNQGTLLDMARIAALQQVVMALQSGNFQNTLTNGLNVNSNNPGLQAFQNLLAALGIGNNDQGTSQSLDLEQMFLQLFNKNSAYNYGGFSIVNGGS